MILVGKKEIINNKLIHFFSILLIEKAVQDQRTID